MENPIDREEINCVIVKEEYQIQEQSTNEAENGHNKDNPQVLDHFEIIELIPSDKPKYKCLICGQTFLIKSKFTSHMTKHSQKMNFHCAHCPRAYGSKDVLRGHLVAVHFESAKLPCTHCNKTYKNIKSLRSHLRKIRCGRIHGCDSCGKKFHHRYDLMRHIGQLHDSSQLPNQGLKKEQGKPLVCPLCGVYFWTIFTYKRHVTAHKNIKSLQCTICSRTYTNISNLNKHMMTHSSKSFKCEVCGKAFYFREKLQKHQSVHMDRNLRCSYCFRTFAHLDYLKCHHKKQHKGLTLDFKKIENPTNATYVPKIEPTEQS